MTLGMVYGLGMLGLAIAALALTVSVGAIRKTENTVAGARALYAADASVHEGVYQILGGVTTDTVAGVPTLNATLSNNYQIEDLGWPYFSVTGSSTTERNTRSITYLVDLFPSGGVFSHALFSQDELVIGGSAEIEGSIFANDSIDFIGGGSDVDGDAFSPGTIDTTHGNIDGVAIEGVDPITAPTIDPTAYKAQATTDGTVYSNPFESGFYVPNNTFTNKIVYLEGPGYTHLITSGNTEISGALIVEGNLILNNITLTPGSDANHDKPLVLYVGGNLQLTGNNDIRGIIYVGGNATVGSGSTEIEGSIITNDPDATLRVSGSLEIVYDPTLASDWTEIDGIDFSVGDDPKVHGWSEE